MAIDVKRVESIFQAVAELGPSERAAVLERECAGDAELRRCVEALLKAHDGSGELPAAEPEGTAAYVEPGQVFAGRYKLREKLGEGGMGVAFVADQTEPVQRRVALKIIRAGLDTRALLARFEQERQALALMDHPNIAKVFDAGIDEAQRPYFAMELVKGLPLTKYCDDAKLSPRQRIELFIPVCQAVQHAHQKGIVHRDLKPTNILVGLYDGRPVPKVIDFGVAKAMGPRLTEQSIYTEIGSIIGTLEYMSPEQAELNNLDIDTRSDIYALGVILYELLTGAVPFHRKELEKAGLAEMLRMIKEVEPAKPSTKLSHSGTLPSIAARRQMEPKKLTALVRGDLDWIVMKALEKDRGRRYETANGLAMDVERYLAGEPVLAAPPSARYRLRKFARKHRTALSTALAIVLLLVAGVAVSTWQAVRATNAERAFQTAAAAEKSANEQAQKRLAQIEKGNEIITSIFTDLDIRQVKKGNEPLEAVLARRLVKAAGQLEGEAVGDPLIVGGLQDRLGQSLLSLGHPEEAIPLFEKSRATRTSHLGADHPHTLTSKNDLAVAYRAAGKPDLALPLFEETLKLMKASLGPDHPHTLVSMNNLADGYQAAGKVNLALPLFEETLKLRKAKLGHQHPDTLRSMGNLAGGYRIAGKLDLALPLYEETLMLMKAKLGADHPDTLTTMSNLADGYRDAGKLDRALPLCEETLKLTKDRLGADHPDTLTSMTNLALGYQAAGKLNRALPLYEESLKLRKAKLGADHPGTLASMNNLALGYQAAGKLDLALPLYEETLKLRKAKLGADHPDTFRSMNNLAMGYQATGKLDLAISLLEETLKLTKSKLGADHPDTLTSMNNLALGYKAAGKLNLALPLYEETLKLRKAKLGADHPDTLLSMNNLAAGHRDAGKLDLALPLFQEAAAGMEKRHFQHQYAAGIVNNLADCHERLKQYDQAETWRRKWLPVVKERSGADSIPYAGELAALGLNLLQQKKWTDAEPVLLECLAIREKKEPNAWTMFNTKSLLGGAILEQARSASKGKGADALARAAGLYREAESLLLAGYEGMKKRADKIPPQAKDLRLRGALERLVQLYEAMGKKDQAEAWRKKLQEEKSP